MPPSRPARASESAKPEVGAPLNTAAVATPEPMTSRAPSAEAIPARGPCRASHSRASSGVVAATVRPSARAGRRSASGWPGAHRSPRRIGVDLVAPDDARDAVAGVQEQVERGRGNADQRLDPVDAGALGWGEGRHGGAIVDSRPRAHP